MSHAADILRRLDSRPPRPAGETVEQRKNSLRAARMDIVDSMSPELRELIHEYGLTVVTAFLQCGVTKPKRIRHLVETVLNEFSPTRGSSSLQGIVRAPGLGAT